MPHAPSRPLITPRLVPPALLSLAGCLVAVTALAVTHAGERGPGPIDRLLDPWAHRALDLPAVEATTFYFIQLGNPWPMIAATVAAAGIAGALHGRRGALLVPLAVLGAVGMTKVVLKPWVGRYHGEALALPSTHVTGVATLALTLVVVAAGAARPTALRARLALGLPPPLVAAATTVSVVAERTHYTTDVLAAWFLAAATVTAGALLLDHAFHTTGSTAHAGDDPTPERT